MTKFIPFCLLLIFNACAQKWDYGRLDFVARLPSKLSENSGIEYYGNQQLWVIEDNGNKDHLYAINLEGKLIKEFDVKNATNHDWEDLATDIKGNLYIGDFGNNSNERKKLHIYKLPNPEEEKGKKIEAKKITFKYPEQEKFPPKKENLLYDAEGFFHWGNHLYIITKNRSRPYSGKALVYRVPDKKGSYEAELLGEFITCENPKHCSVTAADISDDGKQIVLIGSGGMLWHFSNFDSVDTFFKGNMQAVDLYWRTQLESVCFLNDTTLLLSDEQSQTKGRNLHSFDLNKLKTQNQPQN